MPIITNVHLGIAAIVIIVLALVIGAVIEHVLTYKASKTWAENQPKRIVIRAPR